MIIRKIDSHIRHKRKKEALGNRKIQTQGKRNEVNNVLDNAYWSKCRKQSKSTTGNVEDTPSTFVKKCNTRYDAKKSASVCCKPTLFIVFQQ